jgi:hypothetical protein
LELDGFNISSAKTRVDLLVCLQSVLHEMRTSLVEPAVQDEILPTLNASQTEFLRSDFATEIVESTSFDDCTILAEPSQDDIDYDTVVKCRIGLETVRLWRQLTLPFKTQGWFHSVNEKVSSFENVLKREGSLEFHRGFSVPGMSDILHHNNATVVLYFDHIEHETPLDHVENQKR